MNKNIYQDLCKLIQKRNVAEVKNILSTKTDINIKKTDFIGKGTTLLHYASTGEICKELLLRGACVNAKDIEGQTPLHHAIFYGRSLSVVRELIKHGADVNASDNFQQTPLFAAARMRIKKLLPVVQELLKHGADPNTHDHRGITVLTKAIYAQDLGLIKELLEWGADINVREYSSYRCSHLFSTPLDAAVKTSEDCTKLLIRTTLIKYFDDDYLKVFNLDRYSKMSGYNKLLSYLEECVCEIVQMKSYKINVKSTLYDFVTKKSKYARPLYLSKMLTEIPTNYHIYNDIIIANIQTCLKRARLLDKLKDSQLYIGATNSDGLKKELCLNADCLNKIADYLTNEELFNFIRAFNSLDCELNLNRQRNEEELEEDEESCSKRLKTSQ